MSDERHFSLDALRGFAVMGIVLMNVISFALPESAYINPLAYGTDGTADLVAWGIGFVLVDGKMRGLFTILFGASLMLVVERAEAQGQSGTQLHLRRMAWLFVIGLIHHWFIWNGDILAHYALCGLVAALFRSLTARQLVLAGGVMLLFQTILWTFVILIVLSLRNDPAELQAYRDMSDALGAPQGASILQDLHKFGSGYADIASDRISAYLEGPFDMLFGYGFETLGLMLLGMGLFKSGVLTGGWSRQKLQRLAVAGYAFGLGGSLVLVGWTVAAQFDTIVTASAYFLFDIPFRVATTLAHLAMLLRIIPAFQHKAVMRRVADAGRMALSNYILSSLMMTSLFYGYGGALYGDLSRAEIYLPVVPLWAVMLFWSPWWLHRFHYGPLEWGWRSLARGTRQRLRRY